jgi:hypothetical protein
VLAVFKSLPLPLTALIVAVASAAVVSALLITRLYPLRWPLVLLVPSAISYALYWAPVWSGADPSEYSSWAALVILLWSIAGAIACAIVVAVIGRRRKSPRGHV